MTDNASTDNASNEKLYMSLRDEISKRQLSNAENYDRSILTYSSFGLTLSMAFIKEIVKAETPINTFALYSSWGLFICSIICVIISYWLSQRGLKQQLDIAYCYYIKNCDKALNIKNSWAQLTDYSNLISGSMFVLALILNAYFCYSNFTHIGAHNG